MDPQTQPGAGTIAFVLGLAVAVLIVLYRNGTLRARSLDQAPRRSDMGWADLIAGIGLVIVGISIASIAAGKLFGPVSPPPAAADEIEPGQMLTLMIASQVGMLPAALYTLFRLYTGAVRDAFASALRAVVTGLKGLVATLPVLAGVSTLIAVVNLALGRETPTIAHDALQLLIDEPWGPVRVLFIVSAVVFAPVVEEIVFRGLLQTSIAEGVLGGRRWLGIVITSVLFAAVHIDVSAIEAMPVLAVLSVGLGYVYERTGRLWAPIVMHAAFNGVQVAIGIAVASQNA